MATLATKLVPDTGLVLAGADYAAASPGGDACATGAGMLLVVRNGDAAQHTVTMITPGNVDGLAINDRVITVAAGDTAYIPVPALYRDPADGLAHFTYDAVTSVTVAALRLPA